MSWRQTYFQLAYFPTPAFPMYALSDEEVYIVLAYWISVNVCKRLLISEGKPVIKAMTMLAIEVEYVIATKLACGENSATICIQRTSLLNIHHETGTIAVLLINHKCAM